MNDKCQRFQEALPLFFAGSIGEEEKTELVAHLKGCDECRQMYQQELALLATAAADQIGNPLTDHVNSDLLDRYVFTPEKLGETQQVRIKEHLAECAICREIVQKIELLPAELDDLVTGYETPLITSIDSLSAQPPEASRPKITKLFPGMWQSALAAAAAIVMLLGISQYPERHDVPMLDIQFPLQMRNAGSELVFEIPSDPSRLRAKVFVDPEDDHLYNLQISQANDSTIVSSLEHISVFDQQGFTYIGASIGPGEYFLTLSDIEDADTLTQHQSFRVVLNR
ncbi:MAG: zf-HC2 domain-containing protein [candidate division Zixibacteria bacterium]|nr:zf-HC2 domain-containing protein [candidate division Zixibacteria bacterium]